MEKLKVVVSAPRCFAGVDFSEHEELIKKYANEGHRQCIIQYLHGRVEEETGYDIGMCLNGEVCGDFENERFIEGIYDAEVVGYENPCKVFMWNSDNEPRCLLVDAEDIEDMKFAETAYKEKRKHL